MFWHKRLLACMGLLMFFSLSKCDFEHFKNFLNYRQLRHFENDQHNYNGQNFDEEIINKLRWPIFLVRLNIFKFIF
jgi:hypothetical protein